MITPPHSFTPKFVNEHQGAIISYLTSLRTVIASKMVLGMQSEPDTLDEHIVYGHCTYQLLEGVPTYDIEVAHFRGFSIPKTATILGARVFHPNSTVQQNAQKGLWYMKFLGMDDATELTGLTEIVHDPRDEYGETFYHTPTFSQLATYLTESFK